jgi:hypothetical protein
MQILDFEIRRELSGCSVAAGMWNYWDAEHVAIVHGSGYDDDKILFDDDKMRVDLLVVRPPIFRFLKTVSWAIHQKHAPNAFTNYTTMFGIPVLTTIAVDEPEPELAVFRTRHVFLVSGWRKVLCPVLRWLVPMWNEKIWKEDLPLKLRRHRVLRAGFRDFNGPPDAIRDRTTEGALKIPSRVPRLKGCPIDNPPVAYGFKTTPGKTGQAFSFIFESRTV